MKDIKDIRDILYIQNLVGKANECLETYRYDEAIEILSKIPESLDKELLSGVWTTLGDAYLHKGNYTKAITLLNKALKYIPFGIRRQPLSLLGQSCFWNKQYEDTIKAIDERINLLQNSTQSPIVEYLFVDYNLLGEAYLQLPNYKKAIKAFEKALSLKPDYEEARHNLTFAKFKQKQSENQNFKLDTMNTKNEIRWWNSFGTRVQTEGAHTGVIWKFDWGIMSLHKALEYDPENDDAKRGLEVFNHNRKLYAK